jgi:hypothetical protein
LGWQIEGYPHSFFVQPPLSSWNIHFPNFRKRCILQTQMSNADGGLRFNKNIEAA